MDFYPLIFLSGLCVLQLTVLRRWESKRLSRVCCAVWVRVFGRNNNTDMHHCNSHFPVIVQVSYKSELVVPTSKNMISVSGSWIISLNTCRGGSDTCRLERDMVHY